MTAGEVIGLVAASGTATVMLGRIMMTAGKALHRINQVMEAIEGSGEGRTRTKGLIERVADIGDEQRSAALAVERLKTEVEALTRTMAGVRADVDALGGGRPTGARGTGRMR